jgi:hypothetical protein
MLTAESKDRATGWVGRWARRYVLYCVLTWPVATAVFMPWYLLVLGLSWHQIELLLLTSLPYSLVVYLVMAPWGKYVWECIWRLVHGVRPWYQAATPREVRQPL